MKQGRTNWIHDPSQSNVDSPKNVRYDAGRHFRNNMELNLKYKK